MNTLKLKISQSQKKKKNKIKKINNLLKNKKIWIFQLIMLINQIKCIQEDNNPELKDKKILIYKWHQNKVYKLLKI